MRTIYLDIMMAVEKERKQSTPPDFSMIPAAFMKMAQESWEQGDIETVMLRIDSHKHMDFVIGNIVRLISRGLFEKAIIEAYTSINFNMGRLPNWKDLRVMLNLADRKRLREAGDPIPTKQPIKVYRGVGDGRINTYVRGFSWTSSPEVASYFALDWADRVKNNDPAVFEVIIKPENIFFFTNARNEAEYVVDLPRHARPRRLTKVPESKSISDYKEQYGKDEKVIRLCGYALSKKQGDSDGIHGERHWWRVYENAMRLSGTTDADIKVLALFAFLHDAWRQDDGEDKDHGKRAAEGLKSVPAAILDISPDQLRLLDYAIRHHVDGEVSDDPTIGTCWDADRLDLGRVGIAPNEQQMSTGAGKHRAKGLG